MRPPDFSRSLWIFLMAAALVISLVWWSYPHDISPWRSAAIVSGWIGCGLLLASLVLMVREPWLAKALGGLEPMYLWHHRFGIWAYLALLVHPLALAADGWASSASLAWASLAPWQQGWPVWLGWAALVCMMVGLVVSLSPKVTYSLWRRLHHLLTLSVILGGAHLVGLGLEAPLIAMPLLALFVLSWRILRGDFGWAAKPFVVTQANHFGPDVVEISLRPLAQPITAVAGQFVVVAFFQGRSFHGCGEYHPYTLSAMAPDGSLSIGIKALGDCTRHLQSVQPGVAVRVQGPFGNFLAERNQGPGLWIAGGIGITPFLAVLRSGPLPQAVRLIYLHRHAEAAFLAELRALAVQQPLLCLQVITSGDELPNLDAVLPSAAELAVLACYLCGPQGLVGAAIKVLKKRGVSRQNIHFERFDFR
jgi:predicted ferric reductase